MDHQLLSPGDNIQQQFRLQSKTTIISFYIFSLIMFISAILCIVSSSDLRKTYLGGLQITIIISAALCAALILGSCYSMKVMKDSAQKLILFSSFAYLFQTLMVGLAMVSLIITILQSYCGEFITHSGIVDGSYIATSLMTNYNYPTCSSIESNTLLSVQSQVYALSMNVIASYCGNEGESCTQYSTLQVNDWGNQFGVQLGGCITGGIVNLFYIVIVIIIRQRLKKIRDNAYQNVAIQNQIQAQSQNPVYVIVPNQVNNPQPPPPPLYPQNNFVQPEYPNYPNQQYNYIPPQQQQQQQQQMQYPPNMIPQIPQNQVVIGQPYRQNNYI